MMDADLVSLNTMRPRQEGLSAQPIVEDLFQSYTWRTKESDGSLWYARRLHPSVFYQQHFVTALEQCLENVFRIF